MTPIETDEYGTWEVNTNSNGVVRRVLLEPTQEYLSARQADESDRIQNEEASTLARNTAIDQLLDVLDSATTLQDLRTQLKEILRTILRTPNI